MDERKKLTPITNVWRLILIWALPAGVLLGFAVTWFVFYLTNTSVESLSADEMTSAGRSISLLVVAAAIGLLVAVLLTLCFVRPFINSMGNTNAGQGDVALPRTLLMTVVENVPVGLVIQSLDNGVVHANTLAKKTFAKDPANIGRALSLLMRNDFDTDQRQGHDPERVEGPNHQEHVVEIDRRQCVFSVTSFPITSAQGDLLGAAAIGFDITDQRDAITARHESEARQQAIFENLPIGIWQEDYSRTKQLIDALKSEGVTDFRTYFREHPDVVGTLARSTVLIKANIAAAQVYGTAGAEEFEDYARHSDYFEDATDYYLEELSALAEGQTQVIVEHTSKRSSGEPIQVRTTSSVPEACVDTWQCIVATEEDITERRQAEEALRVSYERYRQITHATNVMPWEMDVREFTFSYVGESAISYFGHDLEVWMSKDFWDRFLHPDDKETALTYCAQQVALANDHSCEFRLQAADGEYHWVREIASVVCDEQGPALLRGVFLDISDERDAQQEREQLELQLRQSQKMEAIGQLTGGIAHDFNNILSNVLGYTYLAEEHLVQFHDARFERYLGEIRRAGERASNLVSQMLAFSRGAAGEARALRPETVVDEAMNLLESTLPASVQLSVKTIGEVPPIFIDPGQLHQVVINLCINARDAMDNTGNLDIRIDYVTDLDVVCASCGEMVSGNFSRVSISDTGEGIQESDRVHIFEPFYTTKEVGRGSGMGLSMVHGIVHKQGGHLVLHSSVETGSTFELLFPPVGPVSADSGLSKTPTSEHELVRMETQNGHILVVDDEQSVARLFAELLESQGYEVTYLMSSRAALAIFESNVENFDLVLTDETMPELNGLELIAGIRRIRPEVPVILCTGYSKSVPESRARAMGIDAYLQKPVAVPSLIKTVEKLILASRTDAAGWRGELS